MFVDPSSIRALLLDMNGVLLDDEEIHQQAFREALAGSNITLSSQAYQKYFMGRTDEEGLRGFLPYLSEQELGDLCLEKTKHYQLLSEQKLPSFPGAAEFVREAASRDYALALCTSATRKEADAALRALGIGDLFSALVTAENVEAGKPDPECYIRAAALLQKQPSECLALEDSPAGVRAASLAGANVLALLHTHSRADLQEVSCVFHSFKDLSVWLGFV